MPARLAYRGRMAIILAVLFLLVPPRAVDSLQAFARGSDQLQVRLTLARRHDLAPHLAMPKPVRTKARPGFSDRALQVKFRQGTLIRLREGEITTLGNDNLSGVHAVLARYPGTTFSRLIEQVELEFAQDRARLETVSKEEMPDLNLWYRMQLPEGVSAASVADELNALAIVEIAYPEPLPEPPPVTPDFTHRQVYRGPAGDGIGADAAYTLGGGSGYLVTIFDIEYGWNVDHEDLSKARAPGATILNGTPVNPFNTDHGTATLGVLVADNNGFGVTGIAPGARIRMINQRNTDGDARVNAINLARTNAAPGDVVLLEMQTTGPNGGCNVTTQVGCAPVEWVAAIYDAIKLTTASSIYVVEAAGNGSQNLDAGEYAPWRSRGPSGAFIVGAGGSNCWGKIREKKDFSNYGSMLFLQGWGDCVTTTGYGTLHGSSQSNDAYTGGFGGTSSASAVVAGAVALYSSVAQYRDGDNTALFPGGLLFLLALTATPQVNPGDGQIGGLPDLRRALRTYDSVAPLQPTLALLDQSNGSTTHTDGLVESAIGGTDNFAVDAYYLSDNPAAPAVNASGWTTMATNAFAPASPDGPKTYYAWTKDTNGNISPRAQATITLDTVKPLAALTAPQTANRRTIPVTLTGSDDSSGVAGYYLRPQDATEPAEHDPGWLAAPPTTYTFTGRNGPKTLYAWTKDAAGNISAAATAQVLFDNRKPAVAIRRPAGGSTQRSLAMLAGTVADNLAPPYLSADFTIGKRLGGGDCAFWNPRLRKLEPGRCNAPNRFFIRTRDAPNWQRPIGRLAERGQYFLEVRFIDAAGNIGKLRLRFQIRP